MAAARYCNSSEIHGVLHRVTKEEMERLNKIESGYVIGKSVRIELYKSEEKDDIIIDPNGIERQLKGLFKLSYTIHSLLS